MLVPENVVDDHSVAALNSFKLDIAKVGLFSALADYNTDKRSKQYRLLHFALNPFGVYAKKTIPINKLELVPIVPLGNIVANAVATGN